MNRLQALNICMTYKNLNHYVQVLDNASLDINEGKSIGIIGASGCGKTTLLNCISNNGIILGPIMFLFKMVAATICIFVIIGIFQKVFGEDGKKRTIRNLLLGTIIFGTLAFFIKNLINGDRVELNNA